ncbi:tripartite tricarboxylate transporter substrate binding protein [Paracraurococcus lichenis]|uniref:Tripartite tricarboxylate transporter substrate binding protein n=1 Tax=Paracraurococcus lichenis TaxID=3064888 RepID=A0ABT9E249_9PROT|nr:tripartite tricarboxylate transporter substrate binding protein [Paracraurococcus sp. LOR1-02]MDO9710221.1 tripartite tricarboxylate transporter substrate binding protein [Paracraurococcus sp. LOR1-02]
MRRLILALPLLAPMLAPGLAAAQPPEAGSRVPIRLIVPFAPGGGVDATAHILAPPLSALLGRPILVENRPGGRGIPGAETIARATPDGMTLGLCNTAPLGMAPLQERTPYDALRDFAHIALVAETPSVLVVPAGSRFQAAETYLRAGRSWARGLTYGSPAAGSLQHLQGEMLAKASGARLTHVAYRGTGAALLDLVNGQVDSVMAPLASAMPGLRAGQFRALAVSGPAAEPSLPGVPSFAALGFGQLTATAWMGLSGPRDLPPAMVAALNAAVNRVLAMPEVARALREAGLTPPPGPLGPQDYERLVMDFQAAWRPVVQAAGMGVN